MKIGCLIYALGAAHEKIAKCAVNSFSKFHPDVTLHFVTNDNVEEYETTQEFETEYHNNHGIFRYALALELMEKEHYDKLIILGADTITCARLSEFVEENDHDILGTLDYDYQITFPWRRGDGDVVTIYEPTLILHYDAFTPLPKLKYDYYYNVDVHEAQTELIKSDKQGIVRIFYENINADVICFNGTSGLKAVVDASLDYWELFYNRKIRPTHEFYAEQGGVNIVNILSKLSVDYAGSAPQDTEGITVSRELNHRYMKEHRMVIPDIKIKIVDSDHDRPRSNHYTPGRHLEPHVPIYNVQAKFSDDIEFFLRGGTAPQPKEFPKIFKFLEERGLMAPTPAEIPPLRFDYISSAMQEKSINIRNFTVKDGKLYSVDGRQIKVWHYCDGFSEGTKEELERSLNSYIFYLFNDETKNFFKNNCNCGKFFDKQFKL